MGSGKAKIDASVRDSLIRDSIVERRRSRGDHPEVLELAAYHDGELAGAAREAIRDHLALCPECTRLILDRVGFSELEMDEDQLSDGDLLSDQELAEQQEALKARIREEESPVAEVLPFPLASSSESSSSESSSLAPSSPESPSLEFLPPPVKTVIPWWYHTAAAALLAVALGLGLRVMQLSGPEINPVVKTISSTDEASRGGAKTERIQVSPEDALVLFLTYFEEGPPRAKYRVEILDQAGQFLWRHDGLRLRDDLLSLEFPRQYRVDGSYQLHLYGLTGGEPEHLAQYDIVLSNVESSVESLSGGDPPS